MEYPPYYCAGCLKPFRTNARDGAGRVMMLMREHEHGCAAHRARIVQLKLDRHARDDADRAERARGGVSYLSSDLVPEGNPL